MKKIGKELSFICPACKEKQTSVFESQNGYQTYEYDFENSQWEIRNVFKGEHEAWVCPNCNEDLDNEDLPKKVLKDLGY